MAFRAARRRLIGVVGLLAAAACRTPGPRPLAFGADQCAHCHMTLADARFAGEIVTATGRVIPFDDVGCLAVFLTTGGLSGARVHSVWVHDFARPDSLLDVSAVTFLRSDRFQTPMDYRVVALRPGAGADSVRAAVGGDRLDWEGVLRLIAGGRAP